MIQTLTTSVADEDIDRRLYPPSSITNNLPPEQAVNKDVIIEYPIGVTCHRRKVVKNTVNWHDLSAACNCTTYKVNATKSLQRSTWKPTGTTKWPTRTHARLMSIKGCTESKVSLRISPMGSFAELNCLIFDSAIDLPPHTIKKEPDSDASRNHTVVTSSRSSLDPSLNGTWGCTLDRI